MNLQENTKSTKKPVSIIQLSILGAAVFVGVLTTLYMNNHRQYCPGLSAEKEEEKDRGAKGMEQFFFNARKNISTNSMDYASMLAADIADRAMNNTAINTRRLSSASPTFYWTSMGPTNVGGRTRAILIDKNDPTHQTLFAGGVSGGIWKSTNSGGWWDNSAPGISYSLNDTMQNINVCDIAQDAQGAIYIGTGEGFNVYSNAGAGSSEGTLGGGIFKSTNDGATWRLLTKTIPTQTNNNGIAWAYTNRIAVRPDSFKVLYAATNSGLYVSHDSGATWAITKNSTNQSLSSNALDVKISADGSVIVACVGGTGYYCYPQSAADNIFYQIPYSGKGKLPRSGSRIEFAIAPSDPNRIYASFIDASGNFGVNDNAGTSGIYMTETAKTTGGYWYDIGPGGSLSFDPYGEPLGSAPDQATYDNTVAVYPNNEGYLLCGGTTLWKWHQLNSVDTIGSWSKISSYGSYDPNDPISMHSDLHALVFDMNNSNILYVGSDGGIFHSTDATDAETSNLQMSYQPINRNYNVTQFYTICFTPQVNYANNEGVGGGTQDNGSPYMNGEGFYQNDAVDMSGGDGAGAVVSFLNPLVAYFCSDNGALERCGNLSTLSTATNAYTKTYGDSLGANIDSVNNAAGNNISFVMPVALYENPNDLLNLDSLMFIATANYSVGDTIWPTSNAAPIQYPYVINKALPIGDTLKVPDRVVSRLAVAFDPNDGIWINGQGGSNNTVVWMPIAGPHSTPDAFTGTLGVHALAWTPDGNTLFAGDESGQLFRFSNINSIIANKFISGALWYEKPGHGVIYTAGNQVVSTNLTTALANAGSGGRDILSVSTDPQNGNNVLVTEGNYGQTQYVFYSTNALSNSPTFSNVQGNLPHMPVYGAILDLRDSNGAWNTNSAMLATEHGIYTTTNISLGSSTSWKKNNNGMANCLTLAIKQQTLANWQCNNAGKIYIGSHGRGAWVSNTYFQAPTAIPNITSSSSAINDLKVYPNPMTTEGNIAFNLASADNVIITIYNMEGREVKTINMAMQSPGDHLVTFETSQFQAGIYFATLTGTNFKKVSKFVVVK